MSKNSFNGKYQTKALIVTAAGSSTRMGGGIKKEFISLGQRECVLSKAVKAFLLSQKIDFLVITCPPGLCKKTSQILFSDLELLSLIKAQGENFHIDFIEGDKSRQKSVFKAIDFLKNLAEKNSLDTEKIMLFIHDGARPFVSPSLISSISEAVEKFDAACPAIKVTDTQKLLAEDSTVQVHLDRSKLCAVQTPQAFNFSKIYRCHLLARENAGKEYTDDTEIFDSFPQVTGGKKVHIVEGEIQNKKITYPQDLAFLFQKENRVGFGNDTHRLVEGRKFFLGGLEIPFEKGEDAHSDGDLLLHAITDALLGAAALGDIGSYFPPEDDKWKDASSSVLLKKCWADVKAHGWSLVNLDCVVECERPKILPWRNKIIFSIAQILEVRDECIFVKAKTAEKMDSVGQGKAVKASAVCLLERNKFEK